jgi:hypothetical protein
VGREWRDLNWESLNGLVLFDIFYDVLKAQIKEYLSNDNDDDDDDDDVIVVDIARALRQAVLGIRKKRPAPYFWALFVLHGNWQCRFSRKGMKSVFGMDETGMQSDTP